MHSASKTKHDIGSFIVDRKGKKTGVILDIMTYENLLEDLEDLRMIAERKDEPTVSLAAVEKKLKKHGLL